MGIITTSGVATFGATSNMNVRVSWSESFDTTTITSSKPYGTSTIKITKVEALTKNWYGWTFCPSFWLKFGEVNIHEFTSTKAEQKVVLNSTGVWGTILNANGSIFTTSFTYNRTAVSETRDFTLTKSTTDGWTYPGFYMAGKTSSPIYSNIGGGAAKWSASAVLSTTFTDPSAPTSIYIATIDGESIKTGNYYYYKDRGKARLYWPAGTPGTNNSIEKYRIYISFKGGEYRDTTAEITAKPTSTTVINGKTYYYFDVGGDGDAKRGDYQTYKIKAIGKYSNSNLSSATSPRLCKNRLPITPVGKTKTVPSTEVNASLSYSVENDPDGQTVKVFYSASANGTENRKEYIPNTKLDFGTYYLWSYDGLEFSESSAKAIIRKDTIEPRVTNFSVSKTEFTPYYENTAYSYVTAIDLTSISAEKGDYSNIAKYNFYCSQGSSADSSEIVNPVGALLISSSSAAPSESSPIRLNVGNIITPGNYFKIGVSVTTSLNEPSPIRWDSQIYCSGKALTVNDFSSLEIEVNSKIDNNKTEISNADDIANYFNNYIKISWTNPTIENRFKISVIECGILNEQQSDFTSITTDVTVNKDPGQNIVNLNIANSVARKASVIPAIRIIPVNGTPFIISSKISKTRTNLLSFPSPYSITPIVWNFFTDGITNISFDGNKINGDADFAFIKKVEIKNNRVSSSYSGIYNEVSGSNPGHIEFSNNNIFNTFKDGLRSLGLDSLVSSTYTITVFDRYGNSASTRVNQSIDFRVAPEWTSSSFTTNVKYLNSASSEEINSGTSIDNRILNPGDEIQLFWLPAEDSGNGNPKTVKYKIICYTKDSTDTLYYENGSKFFESITDQNICEFSYTVPFGNTAVNSIFFEVIAIDQSGKTSTSLKTSQNQALAIGRAVAPDYDIVSYKISEIEGEPTGVLTGVLEIKDYGDSRIIKPSWTNYARLGGLKLVIQQNGEQKILTYDSDFKFSDTGYPKSGKVVLSFSLYPSYIDSLNSNKTYLFSFEGPTFSYRNHQIGINVAADSVAIEDENGKQVSKSVFAVAAAGGKDKIYFISNNPNLKDIYLNLTDGKIYNLIIDCGEW